MLETMFLLAAAFVYVFSCWLTFCDHKDKWWFMPFGIVLGVMTSVLWYVAAKSFDDKERMFVFSLLWDAMLMAIYYGLPIAFFGVKPSYAVFCGMALIISGAILVKIGGGH